MFTYTAVDAVKREDISRRVAHESREATGGHLIPTPTGPQNVFTDTAVSEQAEHVARRIRHQAREVVRGRNRGPTPTGPQNVFTDTVVIEQAKYVARGIRHQSREVVRGRNRDPTRSGPQGVLIDTVVGAQAKHVAGPVLDARKHGRVDQSITLPRHVAIKTTRVIEQVHRSVAGHQERPNILIDRRRRGLSRRVAVKVAGSVQRPDCFVRRDPERRHVLFNQAAARPRYITGEPARGVQKINRCVARHLERCDVLTDR